MKVYDLAHRAHELMLAALAISVGTKPGGTPPKIRCQRVLQRDRLRSGNRLKAVILLRENDGVPATYRWMHASARERYLDQLAEAGR